MDNIKNMDLFVRCLKKYESKANVFREGFVKTLESTIKAINESVKTCEDYFKVSGLIFENINLQNLTFKHSKIDEIKDCLRCTEREAIEACFSQVTIELRVKIKEKKLCKQYNTYDNIIQDEKYEYGVQIIFCATIKDNYVTDFNNFKHIKSAWHLDKHIRDAGSLPPQFIHPEYHLNMGGFAITKDSDFKNYGQFLLVDAPRIMHPPLDVVLAIDFILKQFYEKDSSIKALIESESYENAVRNSQKRLWQPFFKAIASYWDTPKPTNIEPDYPDKLLGYK